MEFDVLEEGRQNSIYVPVRASSSFGELRLADVSRFLRLFLEYARVMSPDRNTMDYLG